MLRFKSWRKSPALTQETTPSQRRITRTLSEAQQAAARELDAVLPQVAEVLSRGQVDRVLAMLPVEPWLVAQEALAEELLGELLDAGSRVRLPTIQKETLEFSFDRGRPESAQWARYWAGALITQITNDQRDVVREIVALAASGMTATPYGGSPYPGQRPVDWAQVARTVRGTIGLTTQQAGWVANHYDRAYTTAIRNGAGIAQAAALAARSADRYQTSVHRYRANTIARTETMRAASEGRIQAWNQGLTEGFIDPLWQKEWIAEADACPLCLSIDGKRIGVKDSFPVGEPPAHPNCRCDVLLVPPRVQPQPQRTSPFDVLPLDQFAPALLPGGALSAPAQLPGVAVPTVVQPTLIGMPAAPAEIITTFDPWPSTDDWPKGDPAMGDLLAGVQAAHGYDHELIEDWVSGDMEALVTGLRQGRTPTGLFDRYNRGLESMVIETPEAFVGQRVVPEVAFPDGVPVVGMRLTDDGWSTVAVNPDDWETYRDRWQDIGEGRPYVLRYEIPQGSRGVYMAPEEGSAADGMGGYEENEFVLRPGTVFEVVEIVGRDVLLRIVR